MNLIPLTVKTRNGKPYNAQMLIDVDDIATPLTKVGAGGNDTSFSLREGKKGPFAHFNTGTALTTYVVDETLAQINAAANEVFVANVQTYKGRSVAGAPEMGFNMKLIAGRIERDTINNVSRFFYQEDSDPALVEYGVTQTLAQIVAQLNTQFVESVTGPNVDNTDPWNPIVNDGSHARQITRAAFLAAMSAQTLVEGYYLITDRADLGVLVRTVKDINGYISNAYEARGVFLNADYQFVGDYSGVFAVTGVAVGNTGIGVWDTSLEASISTGDIVFWNGLHYQVTDDAAFAGTNPAATPLAYTVLPKSAANVGYIREVDFVHYNIVGDYFAFRADNRDNKVWYNDGVFQWGNDNVTKNTDTLGTFNCRNNKGSISNCYSNTTLGVLLSEANAGSIDSCVFGRNADVEFILSIAGLMDRCEFNSLDPLIFSGADSFTGECITESSSSFPVDLDMSDAGIFAAGVLTVPSAKNYAGIITLVNNTGQTISKIENTPSSRFIRFKVEAGNTQDFSHAAIGVAVADNLVSDAAAVNTIVGRANGSDFIDYRRSGNINVRENAAILV